MELDEVDVEDSKSEQIVTVDDPKEEGRMVSKFVSYAVTVRPPPPGTSHVRRRFSDFEWLRDTLKQMFPGVFIPSVGRKQVVGRFEDKFLTLRALGLQRFMRRIAAVPFLAQTDVYQMFISRHADSFPAARKDIENAIKEQTTQDVLDKYARLFPRAIKTQLPDSADEGVLRLRECLERSEKQLVVMTKAADAAVEHAAAVHDQLEVITAGFIALAVAEDEYAQRPEPKRLNFDAQLATWSAQMRVSSDNLQSELATRLYNELDDVTSFLEIIKTRDDLRERYEKCRKAADKYRSSDKPISEKDMIKRDESYEQESLSKAVLEVVTKVILCSQIQLVWAEKMRGFRRGMHNLAAKDLKVLRTLVEVWRQVVTSTRQ